MVKKTMYISEELYRGAISEDKNFSRMVRKALEVYLRKGIRKIEEK